MTNYISKKSPSNSLDSSHELITRKTSIVSLIIEVNEDGYLAKIPNIQGAFAEGDTPEEAIFNCIDVLKMIIDYRKEQGNPLDLDSINLTTNNILTFTYPVTL